MTKKAIFETRRSLFFDRMDDGIAIIPSAREKQRNADITYPFRQDTDFYYLTGFEEPESVALLIKDGNNRRFVIFLRARIREEEQWTGRRLGPESAIDALGADEAFVIDEFWKKLPEFLTNKSVLYYLAGMNSDSDARINSILEDLKGQARLGNWGPWTTIDPRTILWNMRMYKSDFELENLKKACAITTNAFSRVIEAVRPGMFEYEVQALLEYEFRRGGSNRLGFETITAAGANATTLHYVKNDQRIGPDDMVLLDAGCEYGYITSDVTRTFPAGKHFSEAQRDIYTAVLDAQKASITKVRPGNTYQDVHMAAVYVLSERMRDLGILTGSVDEIVETRTFARYFPHRIGHWLGMDVHDCGPYFVNGESITLAANMVMTVEPGLYIPPEDEDVPAAFRGIGVRIEDDVLITKSGHSVLTCPPKEPKDLI